MKIILASASPRRKELLAQIGIPFEIHVSNVDEAVTETNPAAIVEELSKRKASAVLEELKSAGELTDSVIVIGSDTIVACDGEIMGKPVDAEDAGRMISRLSGRAHEVYTGVTLAYYRKGATEEFGSHTFHEATKVYFAAMSEKEIATYLEGEQWSDKAGAYAIQGFSARYITGIEGDYNNVVGLPVCRLYRELKTIWSEIE